MGGLSIDSDHHFNHSFFFPSSSSPFPFLKANPFMDSSSTIDFSMNLDNNHHHHHQINEMDFFSARDVKKEEEPIHLRQPSKFTFDVNTGLNLVTANTSSEQSSVDDGVYVHVGDRRNKNELAVLQAELNRINDENQRLKAMLDQVSGNYNALHINYVRLMEQQNQKGGNEQEREMIDGKLEEKKHESGEGVIVPRQFMDLGLAATTETEENSQSVSDDRRRDHSPPNNLEVVSNEYAAKSTSSNNEVVPFDQDGRGNSKEDSPEQEGWGPNKVAKLNGAKSIDQAATEATMRKARVSVRARSEAPMITDGCQWRKYGQKMAKGNPCPRAYYRCTMAAGCPVRKQVQRCAEDRTILVTTYEGNHNHPLPPAAMAMASTTSAAASVLLSGSMSSADGIMNSNYLTRTMLPCSSSMATISASAPFPTVTLDLTNSPNPLQFQRPQQTQFHLPFMTQQPQNMNSSSTTPQSLAQVFGQNLYNQSKFSGLQVSQNVDSAQAQFAHQPPQHQQGTQQPSLADTVSAATAAITADPNFTAALAAAISSIIGGGGHQTSNDNGNGNSNTTNKQ